MGWINGILGLWLIIAPFVRMGSAGYFWANLVVGILVAIFGFSMLRGKPSQGWISGVLGIWMVISAFIPALLQGTGVYWNDIIIGVIIAIVGFSAAARRPSPAQ